jgi:hypothetical protein
VPAVAVYVAALVLAGGPLVVGFAVSPIAKYTVAQQDFTGAPVAVVNFQLAAHRVDPTTVKLTWDAMRTRRARYAYRLFKGATDECSTIQAGAAPVCNYSTPALARTTATTYTDPGAQGRLVYRVALVGGWSTEQTNSNMLLLSKPVSVPAR